MSSTSRPMGCGQAKKLNELGELGEKVGELGEKLGELGELLGEKFGELGETQITLADVIVELLVSRPGLDFGYLGGRVWC